MKKLIAKFCLLVLVVGAPLVSLNVAYTQTNFWAANNSRYYLNDYPDDIQLLNLGNSHERAAFRWTRTFSEPAHNFALSSQSPRYGFNLLEDRKDALAPGAVVLIPVSYFDFETDFIKLYSGVNKAYNTRYYATMQEKRHIVSYSFEDDLLYNYFPALTAKENLVHIIDDIPVPTSHDVSNATVVGGLEDVKKAARWKAQDWEAYVTVPLNDEEAVAEATKENVYWIERTIAYCYENGYTPVLLSSPVTDALTLDLPEERIKRFDEDVEGILSDYPDLLYLDYSRDERFSTCYALFADSDHLNARGGDAFTMQVLVDLAERGVVPWSDLAFEQDELDLAMRDAIVDTERLD